MRKYRSCPNAPADVNADGTATPDAPLALRVIANVPWLQRRAASFIGLGVRPEHIRIDQDGPLRGRVFALLGYELVEGHVAAGALAERRRVHLFRDVLQ